MGNCQENRTLLQMQPKQIFNSIVIIQKYIRRFQAQKKLKRVRIASFFIIKEKSILKRMNYTIDPYFYNDKLFKMGYQDGCQIQEIVEGKDNYFGQIQNGEKLGIGIQTYSNQTYYIGQFVANNPSGQGRMVTIQQFHDGFLRTDRSNKNGCLYEGEFVNGFKQGKGKLINCDGSIYTGQFKDGKIEGHGRLVNLDGSGYSGQWKDGQPHGSGTISWSSRGTYSGEFKNGLRDGQGQYEWGNGQKYSGGWSQGKQHGEGYTIYNGIQLNGQWQNGVKLQ